MIKPFLDHVNEVFPDSTTRLAVLSYMAACVQYKSKKFNWCMLLQGNGTSLFSKCVERALPSEEAASFISSPDFHFWNEWATEHYFCGIKISEDRIPATCEDVKALITNKQIEIRAKGEYPVIKDIKCNFLLTTDARGNLEGLELNRRIYHVPAVDTPQYHNIYTWLHTLNGFEHVAKFLQTFAIPPTWDPTIFCKEVPTYKL